MALWAEILKLGASGSSAEARLLLLGAFRESICTLPDPTQGITNYRGPLPKAVNSFFASLPLFERSLAETNKEDFIDYILDSVIENTVKTLNLVEIIHRQPQLSLNELVGFYGWANGYKRSPEQKRKYLADLISSMLDSGIELPKEFVNHLENEGEPRFEFNEITFATSKRRIVLSWNDFKRDQELDFRFVIINDDVDSGVDTETVDFSTIRIADLAVGHVFQDPMAFELKQLGQIISHQLSQISETHHSRRPTDGYRPIARHNVFWNITDKYEVLTLRLEKRIPYCKTDQDLSKLITERCTYVKNASRPTVLRKRKALYNECENKIIEKVREILF